MARAQNPNSPTSQFFIMFAEGHFLNGQYTVFGRVIEGMEVVDAIQRGAGQSGGGGRSGLHGAGTAQVGRLTKLSQHRQALWHQRRA